MGSGTLVVSGFTVRFALSARVLASAATPVSARVLRKSEHRVKIPLTTGVIPVRSMVCQTAPFGVFVASLASDDDEFRPPHGGVGDGVCTDAGRPFRGLGRSVRGLAEGLEACRNAGRQHAVERGTPRSVRATCGSDARSLPVYRGQLPASGSFSCPRTRGGGECSCGCDAGPTGPFEIGPVRLRIPALGEFEVAI